jgi:hypothetical protein
MLVIFLMLTCTVSLTLHKVMVMAVRNGHPDIELVSPVCLCTGGTYYEYPVEGTDKGVMMKFDFRINPDQDESGGILMYEIRRKGNIRSDHQSNVDTIYAKAIEEVPKMMRLLVIWKTKRLEEPDVSVILVEYDNELVLNGDKLAQLYENVNYIPTNYFRNTWLIYDNMALAEKHKVLWYTCLELEINIYRGFRNKDNIKPMWINSERQASSLII